MKNKILNLIVIISLLIILIEILFHKNLISNTINYSLNLWTTSLIPSMFPFFVISDLLINYSITNYIPKWIKNTFTKLFQVNESVISIFFLSLLSGFPSNARNTRILYDKNIITKKEAENALIFTHFANPLFVLSTISVFFLHNETYGYIILTSHYLGNIIIGILTRNTRSINTTNYIEKTNKSQNFSTSFINAIKNSINTLLTILGTLTCFLILSSLILEHLNLNSYNSTLLKGILEITMGLKSLSTLLINDCYKVVISTIFISFGGLSVHLQVLSQLTDTDISYHPFFISRIFHALISGIISFILFILIF